MSRKRNSRIQQGDGRGNNRNGGGARRNNNNSGGGRQSSDNGFHDQRNQSFSGSGGGAPGGSGRSGNSRGMNGGRGGGRIPKFTKFADVDNRKREPENWGRQPEYRTWNGWVHNNSNNPPAGGFAGTSNIYSNTDEMNGNNNSEYSTRQAISQDRTVSGNSQQVGQSMNMSNQNPTQTEPEPLKQLKVDIPSATKDTATDGNGLKVASGQQNVSAVENVAGAQQKASTLEQPKLSIKIKQEKNEIKLKTEQKSSSSSSSSSSDSSSSDEEPQKFKTNTAATVTATKVQPAASLLTIKTSTQATSNTTITSSTKSLSTTLPLKKQCASSASSSSSSSSESEEEQRSQPLPSVRKEVALRRKEADDDVVCLGNLENKIVLEDEDQDEDLEKNVMPGKSQKKGKKSDKKLVETCMLCDKKGHTSFQCQMICKNCSAPYHGFRTCPHPSNLNTMLQLFMEFTMQQLQNFQPDKQFAAWFSNNEAGSTSETVPKPLVGSPSPKTLGKTKKRKSQLKTKDSGRNMNTSKKRKILKKKYANADDTDSSTPSEESSSEEDSSSEGFQSLSTSKNKKSSTKQKFYPSIPELNMASFMPNTSLNYPLNLNRMGNIPAAPPNSQLNTLLLTQMFQNAIGSLSNKKS